MKKNILLLLAIFLASVVSYAQQATATLNHNDTITTFYGIGALVEAHNSAAPGDVITLSSGQFTAPTITKNNLTIIGAGMDGDAIRMEPDTSKWVLPTILVGDFKFGAQGDVFYGSITLKNLMIKSLALSQSYFGDNPSIIAERCFFRNYNVRTSRTSARVSYTLYNCSGSFAEVKRINAVNSYIYLGHYAAFCHDGIYTNCIVKLDSRTDVVCDISNSTLSNCIVFKGGATKTFRNGVLCQNTLYIGSETNAFSGVTAVNCWSATDSNIFKEGTYYELIEEIAQKYLGTDGTEIGIYGGAHSFSPTPIGPRITRCDVAPKTTPDGKLSVHIEVGTAQ